MDQAFTLSPRIPSKPGQSSGAKGGQGGIHSRFQSLGSGKKSINTVVVSKDVVLPFKTQSGSPTFSPGFKTTEKWRQTTNSKIHTAADSSCQGDTVAD